MADMKAKVILTDIEGTTTSISFVKDILFPYAKQHTKAYLDATWKDSQTQDLVDKLIELKEFGKYCEERPNEQCSDNVQNIANFVNYLIEKDLKLGPLKTLQGLVWEKGYADGKLQGHVYDDVPAAFARWQSLGLRIAIYSSGSIQAQQLLFGQTTKGDLKSHICGYYDTTSGHKQESQSYVNIAKDLKVQCGEVLFLTDIPKEAEAACSAGMQSVLLRRPGNAPLTCNDESRFCIVNSFDEIKVNVA